METPPLASRLARIRTQPARSVDWWLPSSTSVQAGSVLLRSGAAPAASCLVRSSRIVRMIKPRSDDPRFLGDQATTVGQSTRCFVLCWSDPEAPLSLVKQDSRFQGVPQKHDASSYGASLPTRSGQPSSFLQLHSIAVPPTQISAGPLGEGEVHRRNEPESH